MANQNRKEQTSILARIAEASTRGVIASAQVSGMETAGHLSAGADAARETGVLALLLWAVLSFFSLEVGQLSGLLATSFTGWLAWRFGRAAHLGWSRLERLHRTLAEERWKIEHRREEKREELRLLYRAKGFSGKLLEEVVEVLMADGDRLLRVMLEEELGLSLEVHEHPLKQGLGASVGVLIAGSACALTTLLHPTYGALAGAFAVIGLAAGLSAYLEGNRITSALVWNVGLAAVAVSLAYYLTDLFELFR